jgi:hypothetical protein
MLRIFLPRKPVYIKATNAGQQNLSIDNNWDASSHTLLLKYENQSSCVQIKIAY